MKKFNSIMLKIAAIAAIISAVALMVLVVLNQKNENSEEVFGTYGTKCFNKYGFCQIAIYDGMPGKLIGYYVADLGEISENDLQEYFYLAENVSKEEMESLGYDVSEGSNEGRLYDTFGSYVRGFYYYP